MGLSATVSVSSNGDITAASGWSKIKNGNVDFTNKVRYLKSEDIYLLNAEDLVVYYNDAFYRCEIRATADGFDPSEYGFSGTMKGIDLNMGYSSLFSLGGKVELTSNTGSFTPGAIVTANCNGKVFEEISSSELRYNWYCRDGEGKSETAILSGDTKGKYTIEDKYKGKQISVRVTSTERNGRILSEWIDVKEKSDASSISFTKQPQSGSISIATGKYSISWALSDPSAEVILHIWVPGYNSWATDQELTGKTSYEISYNPAFSDKNGLSKYRLLVSTSKTHIYSNEFTVNWTEDGTTIPTEPTHTVNVSSLNVRESPDSGSARIGGLTSGKEVAVVET